MSVSTRLGISLTTKKGSGCEKSLFSGYWEDLSYPRKCENSLIALV